MQPLFDKGWEYKDFPAEPNGIDGTLLHAVERIYPFASQQAGYFPGIVMADTFARIEYTNLLYYVHCYNEVLFRNNICSYQDTMLGVLEERIKGGDIAAIQNLVNDKEKMQEYIDHLEEVIHDLYPKTSIKYQLKDRLLRLFKIRK